MSAELTFVLVAAVFVAWLIMGCSFAAAFKAPFVVLFPGVSLLLAHALMFDNFAALPTTLIGVMSLLGMYVFALMCLRVMIPRADTKTPDKPEAAQP